VARVPGLDFSFSGLKTALLYAVRDLAPEELERRRADLAASYQRAIVIDHTRVPNTDQMNFPLLFNTIDPTLATTANGGHMTNAQGYDIYFSLDPNGATKLDHELEEYNPLTGQVIAWVRIPLLSHATDTVVYMFYGNPNVNTPQQNPTGVWDNNYLGVWHVANGATLSLTDSTSNGNNATNSGAQPTGGEIDGGMLTDGGSFATIGTPASLNNLAQGNATFSAWVNATVGNGGWVLGKDGRLAKRTIKPGLRDESHDLVEVLEGIAEGDRVLIGPAEGLSPNQPARVTGKEI